MLKFVLFGNETNVPLAICWQYLNNLNNSRKRLCWPTNDKKQRDINPMFGPRFFPISASHFHLNLTKTNSIKVSAHPKTVIASTVTRKLTLWLLIILAKLLATVLLAHVTLYNKNTKLRRRQDVCVGVCVPSKDRWLLKNHPFKASFGRPIRNSRVSATESLLYIRSIPFMRAARVQISASSLGSRVSVKVNITYTIGPPTAVPTPWPAHPIFHAVSSQYCHFPCEPEHNVRRNHLFRSAQ